MVFVLKIGIHFRKTEQIIILVDDAQSHLSIWTFLPCLSSAPDHLLPPSAAARERTVSFAAVLPLRLRPVDAQTESPVRNFIYEHALGLSRRTWSSRPQFFMLPSPKKKRRRRSSLLSLGNFHLPSGKGAGSINRQLCAVWLVYCSSPPVLAWCLRRNLPSPGGGSKLHYTIDWQCSSRVVYYRPRGIWARTGEELESDRIGVLACLA